jgi:hypothetical protein
MPIARTTLSAVLLAAGVAAPAAAQPTGATIYRDPNFSGPAVAVAGAEPNLALRFPVYSIRVQRGSWELCPERNFRGRCLVVDRTTPDLRRAYGWGGALQSMRPADSWGGGGSGGAPGGQSLRGMASEFYPAPRLGGGRVEACPRSSATAACAADTADRFCRTAGWNGSARQLMETVNRRVYLADVLCVRSGF